MKNQGGFRLTQTDVALIQKIATRRFQSYPELRETILKDHGRQRSWAILKRLVQRNYLRECRGDRGELIGWRMNLRSKKALPVAQINGGVSRTRVPVYRSSFDHDRVLRSIQDLFMQINSVETWTPEQDLKSEICRRYAHIRGDSKREKILSIPDAVLGMVINGSKIRAALELEMTQKSRKRLFQKIERYVIDPDFRITFYIADGEKLLGILQSVYRQVLSTSLRAKMCRSRNGIYFSTLENILANGESARFQGLSDSIALNKLN